MKYFKWFLYGIGGIFLLILIIALFMPSKYEIERSITIDRHPETVYEKVATLSEWPKWNPWSLGSDSNVYNDVKMGKGAEWEWRSKEQGNGKLRIVKADPYHSLQTRLHFQDSTMTGNGEWRFERKGSKTVVTWRTWGELGYPVGRLMAPFLSGMIGEDLKKGLKNLKTHLENEVPMSARHPQASEHHTADRNALPLQF